MDDLVKRLRDCANGIGSLKSNQGDFGLCDDAADRIEADAKRIAELERSRDDWRSDYHALGKAIVGDTGLSAMTVATQARLFRPRAEAAEARVKVLEEALTRIADTDPDDGTQWFHEIARAALEGEK